MITDCIALHRISDRSNRKYFINRKNEKMFGVSFLLLCVFVIIIMCSCSHFLCNAIV